jgi:extracellular matrix regulatory protein B
MYIHLGGNVSIDNKFIVACFDIEKTTVSKATRIFLKKAEEKNETVNINMNELPKSFIITNKNGTNKVYLSNLNVHTIIKRNQLVEGE